MDSIFFFITLGFFIGTLGTLIGAGGGFILVPILVLLYPNSQPDLITSVSLAVVCLNASSGSFAYAKMKKIDYKSAFIFGGATLPGAIIGAAATGYLNSSIFNKILAALLILISVYLFINPGKKAFHSIKKNGAVHRTIIDSENVRYDYSFSLWKGLVISFFVGFLSSLLGIGGGIIHVPALTAILNFPVHIATATSHMMLAMMAFTGTIVHIFTGSFGAEQLRMSLWIGIGVVAGAQLGARLSKKVQSTFIIRALATALLIVGVRLLI